MQTKQATHTPGPWTFMPMRLGLRSKDRRSGIVINGPDADPLPMRICDMRCDQQKRYDEMRANARLIAAAPELVAACQRVLRSIEWSTSDDRLDDREQAAILTAALEQAGIY